MSASHRCGYQANLRREREADTEMRDPCAWLQEPRAVAVRLEATRCLHVTQTEHVAAPLNLAPKHERSVWSRVRRAFAKAITNGK